MTSNNYIDKNKDPLRNHYDAYDKYLKEQFNTDRFNYGQNKDVQTINHYASPEYKDTLEKPTIESVESDADEDLYRFDNIYADKDIDKKQLRIDNRINNIRKRAGEKARKRGGMNPIGRAEKKIDRINAKETESGQGSKIAGAAVGAFEFGTQALSAYDSDNVAESEGESWGQTASLTAKGAQVGSAFSPLGAAIGGAIGFGTGVVDMIGDSKKRLRMQNEAYRNKLNENKTRREQEQRTKDGEESLSKLQALRSSQLNHLSLNY